MTNAATDRFLTTQWTRVLQARGDSAEAKEALAQSDLPFVTNRGERGGSSVAVAAVNALIYYEA